MMEIVATSDLIRPKPTYNPRVITRFSPPRDTPPSPFSSYVPASGVGPSKTAPSPHFTAPSPPHLTSTLNHVKLPAVTIPFVTHPGLLPPYTPASKVLLDRPSSTSPPETNTPTTPATPATPSPYSMQQPAQSSRPTPKKIYTCKLCGKTFNNSGNFSRHQKVHTGEKPYRCEICGKAFTQSSTLKRHILSHSGDRSYKCQVCSKGYVDPWSLKKHMKNHGFNTYSHLHMKPILPHYKFHPPNVVAQHKALGWPVKPEITPAGLYLSAAVAATNGAGGELPSPTLAPSFKSGGSAFTQVESKLVKCGSLKSEGGSSSDGGSKEGVSPSSEVSREQKVAGAPGSLSSSSAAFSTPDALALYMLDTLKNNMKGSQAERKDIDSKENANIMQFTPPSKTMPEKESDKYTCDKCGRSFANLNNFKTHQAIHAGSAACNGDLTCHQCKAVFITKQQLQSHMSSHASSFWCVYCERSFRNEYNFKQHQTVHTTLIQDGEKKYPTWLESFRQEMLSCVTSLDTPRVQLPPMSSLRDTPLPEEGLESPRKARKLAAPSPSKLPVSGKDELKSMKLKAMMDIDPLGHIQSSTPFYPPTPSLSAERMHQYHHDPLSGFPRPASALPYTLAHPRPIKVEPHNRRVSMEEPPVGRPTPPEEREEDRSAKGEGEEAQKQETSEMKKEQSDERQQGEERQQDVEEVREAPPAVSPPVAVGEKEETNLSPRDRELQRKEDEKEACEALRALGTERGEGSEKEPISYHCNLCDFRDGVLSGLTWHLECQHSLASYDLIKTLLSCLGDIAS